MIIGAVILIISSAALYARAYLRTLEMQSRHLIPPARVEVDRLALVQDARRLIPQPPDRRRPPPPTAIPGPGDPSPR